MCILIACKPGATPTLDALEQATWANPDGFGYAIHTGERIIRARTMRAGVAIDDFIRARKEYPDGPAIFHARIGTHGSIHQDNCHPFKVGGNSQIVLAHNGIFRAEVFGGVKYEDRDDRSDTRVFAETFFSTHGWFKVPEDEEPVCGIDGLDDLEIFQKWEDWMGSNKVAILANVPYLRDDLYIFNEDQGTWVNGVWFSNNTWKPLVPYRFGGTTVPYRVGGTTTVKSEDKSDASPLDAESVSVGDWCRNCGSLVSLVSYEYLICEYCYTCLMCMDGELLCQCSDADDPRWRAIDRPSLFAEMTDDQFEDYEREMQWKADELSNLES